MSPYSRSGPALLASVLAAISKSLLCRVWASLLALMIGSATQAATLPNVVVFLSDDQGYGDFSFQGNQDVETPNIDGLVRDGALFRNFFVCPVCSPTRAEFLTGRYHPRSNVFSTSAGGERMDLDEVTIAEHFAAAGYATAAFGKWHNGMQYPYHPNARGFHEYYGFCSGHWGHYFSPMLERNGVLTKGDGFCVDDFTNHAIRFIESQVDSDKPFFVYLPYNTPHSPMQVPERFWEKYSDYRLKQHSDKPQQENDSHTRAALAMCENIDWNVGRLLKRLDELQIAENTIVCYFNDNGPNGWRWNAGLKGRKGSTDEGGTRSPLIVRWPGKIKAGTEIEPVSGAIDLMPTLCTLCKVEFDSEKKLDGIDRSPLLLDSSAEDQHPDRMLFSYWRNRVSVRTNRWRLDDKGRLYDIRKDPSQTSPANDEFPAPVERLKAARDKWKREVVSELNTDQRPFPIGHADSRYTQLPARDAVATGAIKRSNRYPNCSFFTNWVNTEDRVSWPVEVLTSGRYRVELYYTCSAENVGTTLELDFGGRKLAASIEHPHDPPLVGAKEDRSKRTESYVKDFRALSMGEIKLEAGTGNLVLRATEIPGEQSIDFRLLFLTRVE